MSPVSCSVTWHTVGVTIVGIAQYNDWLEEVKGVKWCNAVLLGVMWCS